jgi:SAM-dependent methyltransferase
VVTGFYVDVLKRLIAAGDVSISDRVLVTCGGALDGSVMARVGFDDVTVTNLDDAMANTYQDADNLTYDDKSFDVVVVHAGLHHCRSPHRAMLEMYRVARKCIVVFEARNSLMMRAAVRLGLTVDYELEGISDDFKVGGLMNGAIPNFIYRWTERDVRNTIASYDPAYQHKIDFFYELRLPLQRFSGTGCPLLKWLGLMIEPLSRAFLWLAPKQCNEFAFSVSRTALQPWMESEISVSKRYAQENKRVYRRP